MGNNGSSCYKPNSTKQANRCGSSSSGWRHTYSQSSFSRYAQSYPVQVPYPAPQESNVPTQNHNVSPPQSPAPNQSYVPTQDHNISPPQSPAPNQDYNISSSPTHPLSTPDPQKRLDTRYSRIADYYNSLPEVSQALAHAGLEASNLIIGIDFTKSNEWTGKKSYNGRSLHHIGSGPNPYEQAIRIIGKTLAAFDDDNLIPCFGFGDASTQDQDVFSFYPDGAYCNGFEDVLSRYRELVPSVKLAGPTSFAPIINKAMDVVKQNGGQYHVLLIIADGQVTRSVDFEIGELSPQEQKTVDEIVRASKLPLSIVLVGVGDGPWDTMKEFDDNIPARDFDNFQFVNFTQIMSKNTSQTRKEMEFALSALMEIPLQYKATMELNRLGGQKGNFRERVAFHPPPVYGAAFGSSPRSSNSDPFQHSPNPYYENHVPVGAVPSAPISAYEKNICPICLAKLKDMAFGCGHQTCCECGQYLRLCPTCRSTINIRIKLR